LPLDGADDLRCSRSAMLASQSSGDEEDVSQSKPFKRLREKRGGEVEIVAMATGKHRLKPEYLLE